MMIINVYDSDWIAYLNFGRDFLHGFDLFHDDIHDEKNQQII